MDEDGNETTQELHFFYDAQSKPAFVEFEGVKYRYIHNLQGDIVAIIDAAGTPMVEYKYDVWGESFELVVNDARASFLTSLNPFRYRGYIWDEEVALHYISSRYYGPSVGRFINADNLIGTDVSLLAHNIFAYTNNIFVSCKDYDGFLTACILYDNRPNTSGDETGGFGTQAVHYSRLLQMQGYDVKLYGYSNMNDPEDGFIAQWNSMDSEFDRLIIIGHGAPGSIDARGQSLEAYPSKRGYSFNDLKMKTIGQIELYTCNGATPNEAGTSAALEISKRTTNKAGVYALYYAKTYWLGNRILLAFSDLKRRTQKSISNFEAFFKTVKAE